MEDVENFIPPSFPAEPPFINEPGELDQVAGEDPLAIHAPERGGAASLVNF